MRRSLVAVIAVIVALGGTGPSHAEVDAGTRCTFEFEINLSPGFSMEPTSGTHQGTGPISCDGLVNGKEPTGAGTLTDEGRYGTTDGDTCTSEGEGDGVDTIEIPVAGGVETVVSEFSYTTGGRHVPTNGGVAAGGFQGSRFTGTFEFTPLEGDCVTAPLTRARVFGEGVIHS